VLTATGRLTAADQNLLDPNKDNKTRLESKNLGKRGTEMAKEHIHIYTTRRSYDEETDLITARCDCGSETTTALHAKNRTTTAWSAYPDQWGGKSEPRHAVKTPVDQERFEGETMDETD
tara:strand:- start:169 stop:525 length:357 start_codon:yes stop_codon:yes gene_type:complete